jgi:hypothetical protein
MVSFGFGIGLEDFDQEQNITLPATIDVALALWDRHGHGFRCSIDDLAPLISIEPDGVTYLLLNEPPGSHRYHCHPLGSAPARSVSGTITFKIFDNEPLIYSGSQKFGSPDPSGLEGLGAETRTTKPL